MEAGAVGVRPRSEILARRLTPSTARFVVVAVAPSRAVEVSVGGVCARQPRRLTPKLVLGSVAQNVLVRQTAGSQRAKPRGSRQTVAVGAAV